MLNFSSEAIEFTTEDSVMLGGTLFRSKEQGDTAFLLAHMAGDSDQEVASPLFATAVGLVMDGLKRQERKRLEKAAEALENETAESLIEEPIATEEPIEPPKTKRPSFLDKLTERVKDFLDNAE